jgi:hypothetical protein
VGNCVWMNRVRCLGSMRGLYKMRNSAWLVGSFLFMVLQVCPMATSRSTLTVMSDPGEIAYRLRTPMCIIVDL